MNNLEYWKLAKHLSVVQAALLIIGQDPSGIDKEIEQRSGQDVPNGYEAVKNALVQAVLNKELPANIKYPAREAWKDEIGCWVEEPEETEVVGVQIRAGESGYINYKSKYVFYNETPDWTLTTLAQHDIVAWLEKKGLKPDFFFSNTTQMPDYLDNSNKCYAHKLSAAVEAWLHVTKNQQLLRGKTPKQAITQWLKENAARLALSNEAIKEIAKISNWNTEGGAAKTPGNK